MEFGSKFVFTYSDSEEEVVSDDEFDEGMANLESSGDSDSELPESSAPESASKKKKKKKSPRSRSRSRSPPGAGPKALATSGGSAATTQPPAVVAAGGVVTDGVPAPPAPPLPGVLKLKAKKMHHWMTNRGASEQQQQQQHQRGRRFRRADTNVIAVKFDRLRAPSDMHTGDPQSCEECDAILSHKSLLTKEEDGQVWICEFCGDRNLVELMEEEIPKEEDVTYMLHPALSTATSGRSGMDESLVIFCVDTSGSMCVTTEVPGKVRLRGQERLDRLQALNTEREDQYLPRQRRNVTYVSRLQGVQAAVDHQLAEMVNEHPQRRVALVNFDSEVSVIGDGSTNALTITGDKLKSFEEMQKAGAELAMPKAIQATRTVLGDKVFELEEGGQTALGPALLLSVSLACQVPGSKVIICTDGLANVGLGGLDAVATDEQLERATEFYTRVSSLSVENGVSISVISIQGTDCKMVELGRLADTTGGQVNIVDPLKLTQEFGSILADPIIATNVNASLLLHTRLYFRNEETDKCQVTRQVGNVTKETEVTFEYGVRKQRKRDKRASSTSTEGGACSSHQMAALEELKEVPFQLRITYTDLEGARAMRVLTQSKPLTKDRNLAEREINMPVVGAHAQQTSSKMALEGKYTESRMNNFVNQRLFHRTAEQDYRNVPAYGCYLGLAGELDKYVNHAQQEERSTRGRSYSDEEDEDEMDCAAMADDSSKDKDKKGWGLSAMFGKKGKKKELARRKVCSDVSANAYYQGKSANSKMFKK